MFAARLIRHGNRLIVQTNILKHIRSNSVKIGRNISIYRSCLLVRFYTDKHEWVEIDGKIATVGISNYAQEALGDVVFAQLPDIDAVLKQHDECGALESVKAASELYSPISGSVREKNTAVEETPSLINTSCYGKGWLFKVELSNNDEIKGLMTEDQLSSAFFRYARWRPLARVPAPSGRVQDAARVSGAQRRRRPSSLNAPNVDMG
ncbi:hypothetical protein Trydic_g16447 [Trypoxylus dichotomus]